MAQAVYKELILPELDAEDAADAIRKFGTLFAAYGFVKETYVDAVLARETEYPTGLRLDGMALAMPHTSGVHVNRPAIGVAKLKKPVIFGHMGDNETKVEAEMLFIMAVEDPNEHLETLRKVMKVFADQESLALFRAADDSESLFQVTERLIGSGGVQGATST
jgi:PTS system galactitol-specific IIA component